MKRSSWTKLVFFLVSIALILTLIASGCAKSGLTPGQTIELQILSDPAGSTVQVLCTGIADILSKKHPLIRASSIESIGGVVNVVEGAKKAKQDPNKIMIDLPGMEYWGAKLGMPPADRKYTEVRWIGVFMSAGQVLTTTKDIKTPADLAGKKVALTPKAWITTTTWEEALKAWGVFDKINVQYMLFGDAANALRDGLVDVIIMTGGMDPVSNRVVPAPALSELVTVKGKDLRFIPLDQKTLKALKATVGWGPAIDVVTVAPGSFGPAQTMPIEGFASVVAALGCFKDADDELVYEVTKTLAENITMLKNYHPAGAFASLEAMVKKMPIVEEKEIHPGALKYYKEAGLWPGIEWFKK